MFAPAATVLKKLETVQPAFGAARLDEGLRQVGKILATANPAYSTELCIISDLQRNGSDRLAETPLAREVAVRIVDLGERFLPNIAAGTAVRFEPGQSRDVTLVAFGGKREVYGFRGMVMGKL